MQTSLYAHKMSFSFGHSAACIVFFSLGFAHIAMRTQIPTIIALK